MLATEYDFPDVRLPWDARDTHAALRALGRLRVNDHALNAGDAMQLRNEPKLVLEGGEQADVLVFDLAP